MKLLVTSYTNPDLDGVACTFAYTEFLSKNKQDVVSGIFGTQHREASFVQDTFSIPPLANAQNIIDTVEGIIVVDASDLRHLSNTIQAEKVVEIIDHRKNHEAQAFTNAKVQIEQVGSAATLIAEKFYKTKTTLSEESAILLFSAIISNTINFQANVTTKRDREMADWLRTKFSLPKNYVHEMFSDKSQFETSLKETFISDYAAFKFNNKNIGIVQLEIINVDSFIEKNLVEIKVILAEIKKEKTLDIIFLTCIDLEKAFNVLVVIDSAAQEVLERALNLKFENSISKRKGILMRKEIVPLIKEIILKKK